MFAERIERVRKEMAGKGFDQLVVSEPESIWYLTGLDVDPGERLFAFVLGKTKSEDTLIINRLFSARSTGMKEVWYDDSDDTVAVMKKVIRSSGKLGVDKVWAARFLVPLMQACPSLEISIGSSCVDDCRAIKDAEEIKLMKASSKINDEVILLAAQYVHEGATEKEVADYIASEYRKRGAGLSFGTIVSYGVHAADPHHGPDDSVVKPGQCVLIDMGCRKDRYCSDMTRTFYFKSSDPEQLKIHDIVRQANEKAEAMIRPGVALKDVDAAARDLITKAGYGPYFNHRLGHFIGQTDHEQGDVSSVSPLIAKPGMIFSIEPGIYLPGKYGVRIEDLVLVTEDGCEVLNHVDHKARIIG